MRLDAMLVRLGLAVLVLALAGCTALRLQTPEVSLVSVDVEELGLLEQRLGLRLRIVNPNDVDLPIEGLSFEVDLEGVHFASGESNKPLTVPRLGEALLDVSAVTDLGRLLRQFDQLRKSGHESASYRISGHVNSTLAGGSVPFHRTGELRAPKLLRPPKPRAKDAATT